MFVLSKHSSRLGYLTQEKNIPTFLQANFEYLTLSTAWSNVNIQNFLRVFFTFWPKILLNYVLKLKKWDKNWWNWVMMLDMLAFCDFRLFLVHSRLNLTTFWAKIEKRAWTVLFISMIPNCWKSRIFKNGFQKVGIDMPLFVLVQLCQVRAVQNEDQITRNCFYFF